MPPAPGQLAGQPVEEQHSIRQPGHGVGQRELPQVVVSGGGEGGPGRIPLTGVNRGDLAEHRLQGPGGSLEGSWSAGGGSTLSAVTLASDAWSRRAVPGFDTVRLIRIEPSALVHGILAVTGAESRTGSPNCPGAMFGGGARIRTGVRGFAGPCLNHSATPP